MKMFCIKDTIKGKKRQSTEWEMIIAAYIYRYLTKDLYSDYINIFYKSIRERGNSVEKWAMDVSMLFTKEDIHMANKHMKKMLSYLVMKMQNKGQTYHCKHIKMVKKYT